MKFFSAVLSSLLVTCQATNSKYKQSGSQVNRSQQIKKPTCQHGNAIVKSFKDKDEVLFKISSKDNARVVVASDNENLSYSIATPGKSSFKKFETLIEEGNPGAKSKEKVKDKEVDASAIKLKLGKGGYLKVKAEIKKNGKKARSLAESATVAILNPGSALNVCYETESLINPVGALCDTDSGVVQGGGDGVLSGTVVISTADDDSDVSPISILQSGDDG